MAYVVHYRLGWSSSNQAGYIYIDEEGYGGGIEDCTFVSNSLDLDYKPNGWENPIIGFAASFAILNDKADFFTLLPLLTAAEREYRVRVIRTSPSSLTMFEGFIDCNNSEQKYLKNRPIHITASSYLSKLQYVQSDEIETLQTDTFINYLDDCLRATGAENNIRVNTSLYPNGSTPSGNQTMFNLTGCFTEIWHKNNLDQESALKVVKDILKTFDCYIYWYGGYWYIERYEDIFNATTQSYIEYTSGTDYAPADTAGSHSTSYTPIDIQDLVPVGQSQTIGIIQGLKEIEVKVDTKRYFNLTINTLVGASPVSAGVPYPAYRTWSYWDASGSYFVEGNMGYSIGPIASGIQRVGYWGGGVPEYYRGIYTRFKTTIAADTTLEFRFKFHTAKGAFGSWSGDWEDYTFRFYYYLRNPPGNYYAKYNPGTDTWSRMSTTEVSGINYIDVEGTDFDDGTVSCDVSISIPIGTISGFSGDEDFIFMCGMEREVNYSPGPCDNVVYGDVQIKSTGSQPDNNFKGTVNNNMLNKLAINIPLADLDDYNFKNAIFRSTALDVRTTTWTEDGSNWHSIAEHKIKDRFRLYRIVRQKIRGKFRTTTFYRPLRNFTDSEQSGKQFILMGYSYNPERDEMTLMLLEYDNTETMTIS